jgi:hypothetical protein
MVVWGGATQEGALADGAAFDPGRSTWRTLPASGLSPRADHVAVWAGDRLFVWGGCCDEEGEELGDGGVYVPGRDSWLALPAAPIGPRQGLQGAWDGGAVLVWGGRHVDEDLADGARFDTASGTWSELPLAPIAGRSGHSLLWTAAEMVVWGGCCDPEGLALDDGALLPSTRLPVASTGSETRPARRGSAVALLTVLIALGAGVAIGVALYLGRPILRG